VPAISKADADADDTPAEVWKFSSLDREAVVIADWIARDIAASNRVPADDGPTDGNGGPWPVPYVPFVVDATTIRDPESPVLVIDLRHEPGRTFRVIPAYTWSVENNLSMSNMDFFEFADAAGHDGVFRGFPFGWCLASVSGETPAPAPWKARTGWPTTMPSPWYDHPIAAMIVRNARRRRPKSARPERAERGTFG
jgi:hypothetical protein